DACPRPRNVLLDSKCLCQVSVYARGFASRTNVGAKEYSGQHYPVFFAATGFPMPVRGFRYRGVDASGKPLKTIPYKGLDLNLPWQSFDIAHELTNKGIQKFVADYQSTLRRSA